MDQKTSVMVTSWLPTARLQYSTYCAASRCDYTPHNLGDAHAVSETDEGLVGHGVTIAHDSCRLLLALMTRPMSGRLGCIMQHMQCNAVACLC